MWAGDAGPSGWGLRPAGTGTEGGRASHSHPTAHRSDPFIPRHGGAGEDPPSLPLTSFPLRISSGTAN